MYLSICIIVDALFMINNALLYIIVLIIKLFVVKCWYCMSICILLHAACLSSCYIFDLCCFTFFLVVYLFCSFGIICLWLVIWFLDAFRSIFFFMLSKGENFNVSLELFYAFYIVVCVQCFRGSIKHFCFWLKVDSIPSERLSNIKKGENLVTCP